MDTSLKAVMCSAAVYFHIISWQEFILCVGAVFGRWNFQYEVQKVSMQVKEAIIKLTINKSVSEIAKTLGAAKSTSSWKETMHCWVEHSQKTTAGRRILSQLILTSKQYNNTHEEVGTSL